jgi:hypothetical protein
MSDLLDACIRRASEFVTAVKPDLLVTDTRLKEFVNSAYDTTVLDLANHGLNNLRQEVVLLAVPANTLALSPTSTPSVPSMYVPLRLWERQGGGSTWTEMQKVIDHLPVNALPGPSLVFWEFRDQAIRFVGAAVPVDVKIHYMPRATEFQMPRDVFGFPDLVNPVAFLAASRALGGNEYYESAYRTELYNISSIDTKLAQSTPVRLRRRRLGSGLRR